VSLSCVAAKHQKTTNTSVTTSIDAIIDAQESFIPMRTTLTLDDDLLQKAQQISGVNERGPLIHEALLALVQRESARRLAALGASDPELTDIHRRQPSPP
jgi:Arc/MetJ family transcription regulator